MKLPGFIILLLAVCFYSAGQVITNYKACSAWGVEKKTSQEVILIRTFTRNNQNFYLAVYPHSLQTKVLKANTLSVFQASWGTILGRFGLTPYVRGIRNAQVNCDTLQNAGISHFSPNQKGVNLTIDLCPSFKPLDRIVFTRLIAGTTPGLKPIPLALSVSGRWMERHKKDLNWLDSLETSGTLTIVWINHTFNHITESDAPLKSNFMLTKGTNVRNEVLNTEIAMIQRNLTPSVFFRFPGLVSSRKLVKTITAYGLIPIGCNAWLAKGQQARNGSIILIHANGNEPLGVQEFLKYLKNTGKITSGQQTPFYDLRTSFILEGSIHNFLCEVRQSMMPVLAQNKNTGIKNKH